MGNSNLKYPLRWDFDPKIHHVENFGKDHFIFKKPKSNDVYILDNNCKVKEPIKFFSLKKKWEKCTILKVSKIHYCVHYNKCFEIWNMKTKELVQHVKIDFEWRDESIVRLSNTLFAFLNIKKSSENILDIAFYEFDSKESVYKEKCKVKVEGVYKIQENDYDLRKGFMLWIIPDSSKVGVLNNERDKLKPNCKLEIGVIDVNDGSFFVKTKFDDWLWERCIENKDNFIAFSKTKHLFHCIDKKTLKITSFSFPKDSPLGTKIKDRRIGFFGLYIEHIPNSSTRFIMGSIIQGRGWIDDNDYRLVLMDTKGNLLLRIKNVFVVATENYIISIEKRNDDRLKKIKLFDLKTGKSFFMFDKKEDPELISAFLFKVNSTHFVLTDGDRNIYFCDAFRRNYILWFKVSKDWGLMNVFFVEKPFSYIVLEVKRNKVGFFKEKNCFVMKKVFALKELKIFTLMCWIKKKLPVEIYRYEIIPYLAPGLTKGVTKEWNTYFKVNPDYTKWMIKKK